jgi:hypothetical protein
MVFSGFWTSLSILATDQWRLAELGLLALSYLFKISCNLVAKLAYNTDFLV